MVPQAVWYPVIGRGAAAGPVGGALALMAEQLRLERPGDLQDQAIDGDQAVRGFVLELFGEKIFGGVDVDKLDAGAHASVGPAQIALHGITRADLLADCLQVRLAALEDKDGRQRDDIDAAPARSGEDQILGETVGELLTLGHPTAGAERQHDSSRPHIDKPEPRAGRSAPAAGARSSPSAVSACSPMTRR